MTAKITLVSPKGREYTTTDAVEVVNLKARGYRVKPKAKPAAPAPTSSK